MNRYFSKEDIQYSQQAHKKMLNITSHREMQIKTTIKYSPHTCQNNYYQKEQK